MVLGSILAFNGSMKTRDLRFHVFFGSLLIFTLMPTLGYSEDGEIIFPDTAEALEKDIRPKPETPNTEKPQPIDRGNEKVESSVLEGIQQLTVLPSDSKEWDKWDDWTLYSRNTKTGLSIALSAGLGNFSITSNATTADKFMLFLPARFLYAHRAIPYLQAVVITETGISQSSEQGQRNFIIPVRIGPGFQFRFTKFPPLAPFYFGGSIPLGFTVIQGGSKTFYFSWGYQFTVGVELAITERKSFGFRFSYATENVSDGITTKFQRFMIGADFRYYFKGNLFN